MSILLISCNDGGAWVIDDVESMLFFEDWDGPAPEGGVVPFRHLCCRGNDLPVPGRPERITEMERPAPVVYESNRGYKVPGWLWWW